MLQDSCKSFVIFLISCGMPRPAPMHVTLAHFRSITNSIVASKFSQGDESTGHENSVEALRQRGEPNSFSNK